MKCQYCKRDAEWVKDVEVYGSSSGKPQMIYLCKNCDAYVGCHHNTRVALGSLANKALRKWRQRAHMAFDPVWKQGKMTRNAAYSLLRLYFNRSVHIGEADIFWCKRIINYSYVIRKT